MVVGYVFCWEGVDCVVFECVGGIDLGDVEIFSGEGFVLWFVGWVDLWDLVWDVCFGVVIVVRVKEEDC